MVVNGRRRPRAGVFRYAGLVVSSLLDAAVLPHIAVRAFPRLAMAFTAHAGAMSSQLRIGRVSLTGNYYSITTVTAQRSPCFVDPTLAALMVEQLEQCDRSGLTRSFARVVMPDHLHWVMQLKEGTLSRCVQSLKSRSAIAINAARVSEGTVWQRGYYDHLIRDGNDVRAQALYVMANPVRAGLAERMGEYPWAWCRWPLS